VLSPAQLASRLDDRFRLLTGRERIAVPHQQTLRATIDWSYQLLSPVEQHALARLAVFPDTFDLEPHALAALGPLLALAGDKQRAVQLAKEAIDAARGLPASARHDSRSRRRYGSPCRRAPVRCGLSGGAACCPRRYGNSTLAGRRAGDRGSCAS
jgi:hypothetical protein